MIGRSACSRRRSELSDSYPYATSPDMFSVGEDGSKAAFDRLSHECKVREQLMN